MIIEVVQYIVKNHNVIKSGIDINEDLNEVLPETDTLELKKIVQYVKDIQFNTFDKRKNAINILFYRLTRV